MAFKVESDGSESPIRRILAIQLKAQHSFSPDAACGHNYRKAHSFSNH